MPSVLALQLHSRRASNVLERVPVWNLMGTLEHYINSTGALERIITSNLHSFFVFLSCDIVLLFDLRV